MNRIYAVLTITLVAACGGKSFGSLCDQIPAPSACMEACDPSPGAPNTCPSGYHCSPDGKCDAQCTVNGGQCGDGYVCTADGYCQGDGMGSGSGPDANCPAVHLQTMPVTPSIDLVVDRSGSMTMTDITPSRFQAIDTGLFDPATGAVTATQANVYFGEILFAGDQTPCLFLNGFTAPRALNNAAALKTLLESHPPNNGSTPTSNAVQAATADFMAAPPPAGSPPVILLATDGQPNSCSNGPDAGASVNAAKAAYAAGIRLFILGLALAGTNQYLQDMANAGTGKPTGQAPGCAGCAPFYTANNPAQLSAGLNSIINGVLSCDLTLNGMVDPATAQNGQVTLNGMSLMYGTQWTIDPNGMVIHLVGTACDTLKNTPGSTVDAAFPCGSVIF
jgi:von Willebrand factor type A domain-containing protein